VDVVDPFAIESSLHGDCRLKSQMLHYEWAEGLVEHTFEVWDASHSPEENNYIRHNVGAC